MRIGIDARALTGRYTGDRTYWLNLIRALAADLPEDGELLLYSRLPLPDEAISAHPRVRTRILPARSDRLWTLLGFPRALREDGADVAHTQYTTPPRPPCPVVTTVHDISFRLYPEWFPPKHRVLLNLTVPASMRRARRVITVSESSRADILRVYGLADSKVVAIHEAAGPEFQPIPFDAARRVAAEKHGLDRPYVLAVGVLQPRKNLALLVEAFAKSRQTAGLPHALALTGKAGWGYAGLAPLADRLGVRDALLLTGYVPDEDLPALYSASEVTAHPALYEGFGLPPLEAMACGAAVMVSDAPAMPEVAGSGALILPAREPQPWADALVRMLTDSAWRREWAERARERSRAFSWTQAAAQTYAVYREAAVG